MRNLFVMITLMMTFVACQPKEVHHNNTVYVPQAINHGDETGNGGDQVVVNFKSSIQEVIELIEEDGSIDIDTEKLKEMLADDKEERLIIISTNEVLIDKFGEEKEALNFPQGKSPTESPIVTIDKEEQDNPLIILNRNAWLEHLINNLDIRLLVFHEIIPVMGKLDDDGSMSRKFKKLIQNSRLRDLSRVHGRRVETRIPEQGYLGTILSNPELTKGLDKLEKDLREQTGRDQIIGTFVFDVEFYYVPELRGRYQLYRDGVNLRRTTTYSYPVELSQEDGSVVTKLLMEIKKEEFERLPLNDKILETFIALLHLREADLDYLEMEELIDLANKLLPIPLPVRNPRRTN
ncbi:MAG: hypothetical protein KC493_09340 [Bacteriovoracaceae bacterium]|nr:hypothetical protein [Bacteriovoracaceae bacterium]